MKPILTFGDARFERSGDVLTIHLPNDWKLTASESIYIVLIGPTSSCFEVPYNSCFKLDIPGESKLHEFRGMQYLGPVERDDEFEKKIKELLVKFQGAIVVAHGCNTVDVLHNARFVAAGCGTLMDIIGKENLKLIGHCPSTKVVYYSINGSVVSLESIRTAKVNKNEFMNNYERMVQL